MVKIISNVYLQQAYEMLRKLYRAQALTPAKLRKIGFRNKWNYVLTGGEQAGLAFKADLKAYYVYNF